MQKRARISSLVSETAALTIDEGVNGTPSKYVALDKTAARLTPAIRCCLPPHEPRDFADASSYESHYVTYHTHRCSECHHNLPSAHLLELHITELHDPICAARKDAGQKIYRCFVESCDKVCSDWKKRRSHLIDKHNYPRNYDFFIVRDGIDGRRSLLRAGIDEQGHRRSSRERDEGQQDEQIHQEHGREREEGHQKDGDHCEHNLRDKQLSLMRRTGDTECNKHEETALTKQTDVSMDSIVSGLSTLQMIPRSVTFGRRKRGAGLAKS